jgi:hypothetical protein
MPSIALRPIVVLVALLAATANAQEFSFLGRKPDLSAGRKLYVAAGVVPGIPVVFEMSSPERITLRPADQGEHSNAERAVYQFEWQKDKSILFYELADPSLLERLSKRNAEDTALPEGKAYERSVVETFFANGNTLQSCLPASSPYRGAITAYIEVGTNGQQEQAFVLPEGAVAQCLLEATKSRTYAVPSRPFVAKVVINVAE